MIEELKKYKYIKKSNFELSRDKAFDKINIKLWENSGILTAYYMGIIDELKGLAEIAKSEITLSRNDFLKLIEGLLDGDNVPDDVKAVIEEVFKEFDYRNKTTKYSRGDKFYIDHIEPLMDGRAFTAKGNFEIFKIDTTSYKDRVFYYLRRINGTDEILARQDILDGSKKINW